MAHRSFGKVVEISDAEAPEPITFDLADVEDIGCRERVNGKLLIDLVGMVESGSVAQQTKGIVEVFGVCVRTDDGDFPDDWTGKDPNKHKPNEIEAAVAAEIKIGIDPTSSYGRLQEVLDDPDTEIEVDELAELVGWLVESYTGRPTSKSNSSRPGPVAGTATSRRVRRLEARRSERQVPQNVVTSSSVSSAN